METLHVEHVEIEVETLFKFELCVGKRYTADVYHKMLLNFSCNTKRVPRY